MAQRIYLFTRFAIHGSHSLIGFRTAVEIRKVAVWLLIVLWIFAIFWHFTTAQWRHYIPTTENVDRMVRYYAYGIFVGAPHPYKVTAKRKRHPLQRITYLGVKLLTNPLLWPFGLAYLFWGALQTWVPAAPGLEQVATLHTLGAFLMLAFLIAHV